MSAFLARRAVAAPRCAARAFSTTPARPVAKITLVGMLAQTPELQATSTGREILKYVVASNRGFGDNSKTSWFRVTAFENEGPRRDYFQSLPKGSVLPLSSSLRERRLSFFVLVESVLLTMLCFCAYRTLVYVEGDASLDTYEDAEGKSKTSLSIVQREWPSNASFFPCLKCHTDNVLTHLQAPWRFCANPRGMRPKTRRTAPLRADIFCSATSILYRG